VLLNGKINMPTKFQARLPSRSFMMDPHYFLVHKIVSIFPRHKGFDGLLSLFFFLLFFSLLAMCICNFLTLFCLGVIVIFFISISIYLLAMCIINVST
jgi:hypothetical protein